MKCAIFVLLAACSVTLAEEPQKSAAPLAAPPAAPLANPVDQPWLLGGSVERLPDGGMRFPDGRVLHLKTPAFTYALQIPGPTCYFIRTIKPMSDDAMRTGFIPIQSRVSAPQRGPNCTQGSRSLKAVAPRL